MANKVVKQETTYIEQLYKANQKQKAVDAKKKRKPQIGFCAPQIVKKTKLNSNGGSESGSVVLHVKHEEGEDDVIVAEQPLVSADYEEELETPVKREEAIKTEQSSKPARQQKKTVKK